MVGHAQIQIQIHIHARVHHDLPSGAPSPLSGSRSLVRYDLPVIRMTVQWWQSLSAMADAVTGSPNTFAQAPIPTLVVTMVDLRS